MRTRGQGLLALIVAAIVILGGAALTRLGPMVPTEATAGAAPSGAWLCPHGGGKGWTGTLQLANPTDTPSIVRLTPIAKEAEGGRRSIEVPPGASVAVEIPVAARESSTFVEYFGGWVAASWLLRGTSGELGIAAEPCTVGPSRTWYAVDGSTREGQLAFLIVMNPFGIHAVYDVALYTADRQPIRDTALTDLTLRPGSAAALELNDYAADEAVVSAEVTVKAGRLAVSSLGVSRTSGIRSVIGSAELTGSSVLPVAGGAGQTQVLLVAPADEGVRFGATLMSKGPPQSAGGLTTTDQAPQSAKAYPVVTSGPSGVAVRLQDAGPFTAALRSAGPGNDGAATAGAIAPAQAWVVFPTAVGSPARPGVVLVNATDEPSTVEVVRLSGEGVSPGQPLTLEVPSNGVASVPGQYLSEQLDATLVVTVIDGAPIVASSASTSLGVSGASVYALSLGVPIPSQQA